MNLILINSYGLSIYVDKRKLIIDNKLNLKQSNTGLKRLNELNKPVECELINELTLKLYLKYVSSINLKIK